MHRAALLLVCGLLAETSASATTYRIPHDYGVACIDLATGNVLWRRDAQLKRPRLRIQGKTLIAEDPSSRLELDATTGKPVTRKSSSRPAVRQLDPLPVNLRAANGQSLAFDRGNTRHLETTSGSVLKEVDWFPESILVRGDLAILNMNNRSGGAEVYAWDLTGSRLAWEIDLVDHVPLLPEAPYVSLGLDGDRLLVSVDERILAFDISSAPRLLWHTLLPRQPIRDYDAPWSHFFVRQGDVILAEVYEDLVALRASDGVFLWTFDAGMLGEPWPLVHAGRVYVSYRAGEVAPSSWSIPGDSPLEVSALEIRRRGKRWTISPTARRKLPAGAVAWSFLHQPPVDPRRPLRTLLTLIDFEGYSITIDLTAAGPTAFVKFAGLYDKAVLHVGDRQVAKASW